MTAFWIIVSKFASELFKQDQMKRLFRTLCVLCGVSFTLTSCLGDDDDSTTYYGDMAVTQFTLGTLNRYTQSVSSKTGNDTIIKSTVTGTSYPMTIDQLGHRIYNQTPLPVGTDVKHVICSAVSTKNSGAVAIKSMTSDSLKWFSTKDSIDFSQPRVFRVFATDGSGSRDYTVTLNVSQTDDSSLNWTKVADNIDVTDFSQKHLIAYKDSVMLVDRGVIEVSNSLVGSDWVVGHPEIKQLIGATDNEIFAIGNDNRLKVCVDGVGLTWFDESLDDNQALLPFENVAFVSWPFEPTDLTDYVLIAGNSQQDENATVLWRKISQYGGQTRQTNWGQWVYMPVDDNNHYTLPRQECLSMVYYDDCVLATGSSLKLYQSLDQGITWKENEDYTMPSALTGTQVAMAVDKQGRLWLVTDSGQLWQGVRGVK